MTTENVTRCDGCSEEERGNVHDWLRLEEHSAAQGEARTWWVSGSTGRAVLPLHFHSVNCLRGWAKRQQP